MKSNKFIKLLSAPYIVWAVGFIIIPLIMVFYYGLSNKDKQFTFEYVLSIAKPEHFKSLYLALLLALVSTIVCILLAYPLALILSELKSKNEHLVVFIFILPMWMNFLLRTYAWMTLLENNGVINSILNFLHLPNIQIINTPAAIVFGMVYNFLPFMILPLYNSINKIDKNVLNAARDLGANYFQTLFRVIIPLSVPGIISGITMVFVPSLTTFVVSEMLGGGKILLIGNVIEQEFTQNSNWYQGSGLSIVLMIFIIISMVITNIYDKEGEGNTL